MANIQVIIFGSRDIIESRDIFGSKDLILFHFHFKDFFDNAIFYLIFRKAQDGVETTFVVF